MIGKQAKMSSREPNPFTETETSLLEVLFASNTSISRFASEDASIAGVGNG